MSGKSEGYSHEENQYLELITDILERGTFENTRNGIVKEVFGRSMRFSLKNGALPIFTTKRVAWKTCFKELMFFISGHTNNKILKEQGVHIWDANSTREFLDSRGLSQLEEDDLGPVYGFQWRHWNASYRDCHHPYGQNDGIDQLQWIINMLKNKETRNSRRLILTAWNPEQIDQMALPPCHVMAQFNVRDDIYLSCCLFQRSCDVGLGVPFNILSYSFLTHLIANHCGLIAEAFVYFMGNAHIYEEHIPHLQEQVSRVPIDFPRIKLKTKREKIEDYVVSDIVFLTAYDCHSTIKMNMKA